MFDITKTEIPNAAYAVGGVFKNNAEMNNEIKVNEMCLAWYPKNKSMGHELDLFYFMPEAIGEEYAAGQLYFGNDINRLTPKAKVRDVCVADLRPLDGSDVQRMDDYSSERHRNALDLGFQHVSGYIYKIPSDWVAGVGINVDLSQSGKNTAPNSSTYRTPACSQDCEAYD